MFEDPDGNEHIVSLGFSSGKFFKSNSAGVQIGFISEEEKEKLAFMRKHSKSQKADWETFTVRKEKIAVECNFDDEKLSKVHFKFSNC